MRRRRSSCRRRGRCRSIWPGGWRAGNRTQQAFVRERTPTEAAVTAAGGAAISSESWVVAQQAISRLQATRAPLTDALADIDRLYLERSIAESVDGLPEIYALRDKLAAMLAAQDNVLAGLERQLPGQ